MPMAPLSWLADHVEVPEGANATALTAALVKVGLEEETVHPAKVQGPLVMGKVLSLVKETASSGKTVNYCRVDVGEFNDAPGSGKEPSELGNRGIVCDVHNFVEGDLVVVPLPGAMLPGDPQTAARKTYGHISDSMIYSAHELGLGEDHDGIIVLKKMFVDREIPAPGTDITGFLELGEGVLEVNVTPDRGYCFSIHGIAREFSHSTGAVFIDPGLVDNLVMSVPEASTDGFPILVKDEAPIKDAMGADHFVTRTVRRVNPQASTPRWMVERLEVAGMRSLSLAADVTDHVVPNSGQPIRAYDLSTLIAPIVVHRAKAGEKLQTLDEVERELDPEDPLITDSPESEGSRIIGLAGVMGDAYPEVEGPTTDIFPEAAHFDPVSIVRASCRHRLPSEASKRFEHGTDPQLPAVAAQRAVDLLVEYGGSTVDPTVFDFNELSAAEAIEFPFEDTARLVGVDYSKDRVREIPEAIGCEVVEGAEGIFLVTPPSWRPDLVGRTHLVEEVARLGGYGEIPSILPTAPTGTGLTDAQEVCRQAVHFLAAQGLVEVLSYPFVSDSFDCQRLAESDSRRQALRLRNSLADDAPWLRTSILDTLLDTAGRNIAQGTNRVTLFEQGLVARPEGTIPTGLLSASRCPSDEELGALYTGTPKQPQHIGVVLAGRASASPLAEETCSFAWSDVLETVLGLVSILGARVETCRAWDLEPSTVKGAPMPTPAQDPSEVASWHSGRVARAFVRKGHGLVDIAFVGELHPVVCKAFGLLARSCAAEVDLSALLEACSAEPIQVKPVSTFPVAKEDIALVVPSLIPASRVEQVVRQGAGPLLEDLSLFDAFEGKQLGEGKRSLAFALKFRTTDRVLTAKESTRVREDVVRKAGKVLGTALRS